MESTGTGGIEWLLQTGNTASGLNGGFRVHNNTSGATRLFVGADGTSYLNGTFKSGPPVAVKATSYPVTADDRGTVFSNEGAVGLVTYTLPAPASGLRYTFVNRNAVGTKLQCAASTFIRLVGSATTSGGYVDATDVDNTITLVAINGTEWAVESIVGAGWAAH
jgi:hypothetical protein